MQTTERSTRSSKKYVAEPAPGPQNTDSGQYMCIECSQTFDNKLELNSHRQSHVTKKQFMCSHCGRGFHHQVFLQMHERSHEGGISRTSQTKTNVTPARVISTRSSKSSLDADVIHVAPPANKPPYHLNSKVQFKRDLSGGRDIAPRECITRRTQGTSPAYEQTDSSDEKAQFELRISNLSDSTIHLIDPYGNTLEILAEVFNAYAIGETEEDDVENVSPIAGLRISEISAASTSSSVHLNVPDEIMQDSRVLPSPQAEASRPHEPINTAEKKEDLPLCRLQSVSSASMSPKTLPDLSDDAEDVLSTQAPHESDIQDVISSEHAVCQPASEVPKNSTEEKNLPSISQDSLTTCDDLMVTEEPILRDVTACNSAGPDQTETPSLEPDALNHPSSVQLEHSEVLHGGHLHTEDRSRLSQPMPPEPLTNLNPEKDASTSSLTPVTSNEQEDKSLTVASSISGLLLDLNEGSAQLSDSCVNDSQSDIVIENNMRSQKSDEGGAGLDEGEQLERAEVPLASVDESQEVPLVGDDSMTLQTPLALNECLSKSDELHAESLSCTRDPGSSGHDNNLQTDPSTSNIVCKTPIDDEKVDPKYESNENRTALESELKPGSTEADVCSLSEGVSDGASYPSDICSSELESQNLGMSLDFADQRTIDSSDFEAVSMKRDIGEKVFTSLERPASQPVMPEKIPQVSSSTVPFLQDQCEEPLLADGPAAHKTDLIMPDPCQKDDDSSELNPKSGPDMSSPLHDIETLKSNDPEQDENLSSKGEMEADISSDIRQIGASENEEKRTNPIAAPVATPTEALPLANIDTKLDEALSHENIQTPVHVTKSVDVENVNASQKIAESGEDKLLNLLEPMTEGTRSDLLPPCDEDLSLRNNENSHDVSFSVQTLVNLTTACVQAQERVLSQGTKPPDQAAAESMESEAMFMSSSLIGNTDFKDDVLLEKPKVEALLPALCLLEPTLDLSPDLEDLSEKCLLNSADVKDLADNDLDKDLSHEVPHKQYIQMSNADLTENDLADDFVDPEAILLDAPSLEETKDDISAVSVDDESTIHELSDILSPDILDSEYTEGLDDKQMGFRGQCLKCGRRVRRGRKELVWFPDCYKCRLKAKRERRSGEDTGHSSDFVLETSLDRKKGSPDSSNFHVKQEAESAQDIAFYRAESPPLKMFKCPKCEKSFRKSALLAIHVKCHSLPQCLSCGCPVPLDYKTKRTPKRCHKCVQKIKQQKKAERVLCGDDEDDSLDSDSESPFVDEVDLESLSDNEPENDQILSSTSLEEDSKPGSPERETEPFHSILMRKRKKMSPAIQALYCTCQVVLKSGAKQPKICKSCQKPTRDRLVALPKDSLIVGHHAGVGGRVPQLKKTKKQTQSEPDQPNLSLGESSVSCENELSPDEFCKEETEPITELDISDQMVLPEGKEPRLCPQCGKIFKCNRSMKLHLLSHTATQCESCGCRLQKKKRAGRWAKKCRVCRLLTKATGLPDSAMEDVLPSDKISKEKGMTSLRRKMKQSKAGRKRKIQPIAKHKKDLKWMNMMLAVKGLTRKPRKKKEQTMKGLNEEKSGYSSEPSVYSGTVGKATFLKHLSASPKSDPGSSGLHLSQKKLLGRIPKINRKCMYRKKNIIKVEEQQMSPYIGEPSNTQVSVKEEDENQCLECNEIFPSFDLLLSHQQSHGGDPPFTCTQCPQSFSAEQYLSIHVGSHAEGPPFRCPDCNKTFPKRNNLGVHRRVHTGARPYACPDCPCKFRQRGSLILHRYTHRNLQFMMVKPYQCSICNKSFKQKERLVIHERLHTGECPFSCKDCDKVFPSKSRLYAHRKIHKAPGTFSNVEQNASCKEELAELPFQCKDCGKVCSTKASLVLHCKVHKSSAISNHGGSHGENVETTKELPLVSESNLHIKTELEGHPFACKDCSKVCSTKASLVLHRKVHGPDPRPGFGSPGFVCKDCHKVCSTKAKLFLHRKMHKSSLMCGLKGNIGDPPYTCQDCNKVCSTKASFVLHSKVHRRSSSEHILKGNMEKKSFVCKVCHFVCSTKASFVLHRKVHRSSPSLVQSLKDGTVQSPFTCKDCNKVCSTKASLVLHSRVHRALHGSDQNPIPQADVKEKPYHCKECGKIYSTKGRLLSHMKLHTSQDMSEDGGQQLKMDTEEKPFACPICQMRFTRLKILVRHKLIHGEDVFKCGHCGKRFLFHKSLMNHVPVCLKRTKGKSLLGKEKVPKKRKTKDGNSSEESAPKRRKPDNKKAVTAVQKLKNKKLIKAKQLALKKEKSKAKGGDEKKLKKAKAEAEQEPDPEGDKQSDGKPEKPLETVSKEKEIGKDKKPKEMGKVKKVLKKVPVKQKRQKVGSESLKKWRMIAAATVKKRKLQAVITGGKKKVTVKKKGPNKAKTGGKNSKE